MNVEQTDRKHPVVIVLAGLVFAECALIATATIYLVVEILVATPASYVSAIALTVLTAIAAAWLALIAVNILRGRAWVRGFHPASAPGKPCCHHQPGADWKMGCADPWRSPTAEWPRTRVQVPGTRHPHATQCRRSF